MTEQRFPLALGEAERQRLQERVKALGALLRDLKLYFNQMAPLCSQAPIGRFSQREPYALQSRIAEALAKLEETP